MRAPTIIVDLLDKLFHEYGNQLDSSSNAPLFDEKAWKQAEAVLGLARAGYLSDPPHVQLYERERALC